EFSLEFGSHWYEDPDKYRNMDYFDANIDSLYDEIERSTETFIDHYYDNYSNPANPPAWMSLEVASLGLLSKLYSNLNNYSPKQKVSSEFGLSRPNLLSSWIHAFVNLRNLCAHYSRIWNRRFTITPIIPYNTINPFLTNLEIDSNKLYAQLSCIIYILKIISPYNNFVSTLKDLFTRSNLVKLDEMGFPENWEDEEIWKTEN
nr:Abi family protein [Bacteroidota bacterium]